MERKMKMNMIQKVEINLNEITKDYVNKKGNWLFIENAIRSAIVDVKIANSKNLEVDFLPRTIGNESIEGRAFNISVNGMAKVILKEFAGLN